jgi:hypothetical protein
MIFVCAHRRHCRHSCLVLLPPPLPLSKQNKTEQLGVGEETYVVSNVVQKRPQIF